MVPGHGDEQRGQRLRQRMGEGRAVGDMDLGDAVQLGGGRGGGVDTVTGDERVHLAELAGGGDGAAGGLLDDAVFVVEQNQGCHG